MRIGLPKGNIYNKSKNLVREICKKDFPDGKLTICSEKYSFYFLKHRDIPRLIAQGFLDYGITSDEWIAESGYNLQRIEKTNWCHTKIAIIGKDRKKHIQNISSCVTEYVNIAKKFKEKNNLNYLIFSISGSSEGLVPDFCETCIDCVESGTTLYRNGLEIIKIIMESDVWLVGNLNKQIKDIDKILNVIRQREN